MSIKGHNLFLYESEHYLYNKLKVQKNSQNCKTIILMEIALILNRKFDIHQAESNGNKMRVLGVTYVILF